MASAAHFGVLFSVFCFIFISSDVTAISAEQKAKVHEMFHQLGTQCAADHPITEDDITKLKTRQPIGEGTHCFVACILKKIGLIDEAGMLQNESVLENAKAIFDDESELKALADYLHTCSSVNSEVVADGAKGCERAGKAYICMIEKASQFGFDL